MNKRDAMREHKRALKRVIQESAPVNPRRECVYCLDKITARVQLKNDGACDKCAEANCNYKLRSDSRRCVGCGRTDGQHEFACRFGTLTYPV